MQEDMSLKCRESYERNVDTVYRVCLMYLKNSADVDDAVQNTFLKLIRSGKVFSNEEHEKAWLIVGLKCMQEYAQNRMAQTCGAE